MPKKVTVKNRRKWQTLNQKSDEQLKALEEKVHSHYKTAKEEMTKKVKEFLKDYENQNKQNRKKVETGRMTEDKYREWSKEMAFKKEHMKDMTEVLTEDMHNSNLIAAHMINGETPNVYALNRNYSMYMVEDYVKLDTSFTLYNRKSVEILMRDNPKLLPTVKPQKGKDVKWNQRKIRTQITQGILQGESMDDIADRLMKVSDMNESSSIRNARTAVTGAMAMGRLASFVEAQQMGISVQKVWLATPDGRTRHSHALLDLQKKPLEEPFDSILGKINYPGDPDAEDRRNIYNCRCTMISSFEGFDYDMSNRFMDLPDGIEDYEDWIAYHEQAVM